MNNEIMSASEAKKMTLNNSNDVINEMLEKINKDISSEAKKGSYKLIFVMSVFGNDDVSKNELTHEQKGVIVKLNELGYVTQIRKEKVRDHIYDNLKNIVYLEIKWN